MDLLIAHSRSATAVLCAPTLFGDALTTIPFCCSLNSYIFFFFFVGTRLIDLFLFLFRVSALDYSEVAEAAFSAGPEPVKKYRRLAKAMVNLFLTVDLYGCCCVYIVFVAGNLKQVRLKENKKYSDVCYPVFQRFQISRKNEQRRKLESLPAGPNRSDG